MPAGKSSVTCNDKYSYFANVCLHHGHAAHFGIYVCEPSGVATRSRLGRRSGAPSPSEAILFRRNLQLV